MILLNGKPIEIKKFPNRESIIEKLSIAAKQDSPTRRDYIELFYESDADLFQLLLIRKALWFPIDLHIPYFPYSRMDRKSDDYAFTLKSVCKFINWLEFDNVYIYEPHSDVTPALLNHCKIVSLIPELLKRANFDPQEDYIFYPDAGSYKKYSDIIKADYELIGLKTRHFKTGKITKFQVVGDWHPQANSRVYIVDDLCSKGGTFVLAAEEIRKLMGNGEVFLVVAHCENTITQGKIFEWKLIDHVYTTDTILKDFSNKNVKIFKWKDLVV